MSVPDEHLSSRRVLKSRDQAWAKALAGFCVRLGLPPNVISIFSMVFAAGAWWIFMHAGDQTGPWIMAAWLGAIACMQMRLVCNLLDGMVAVEGGKGSPAGVIYNDAPDRLADVLILVGAGYSGAGEPGVVKLFDMIPLGWCAACTAMGTAYVRTLGAALTGTHDFRGPMAKQHRMAVLTVGSLIELGQHLAQMERWGIKLALTVIFLGGLLTCWRRLVVMNATLMKKTEIKPQRMHPSSARLRKTHPMKKIVTLLLAAFTASALASDFPKGSPAFKTSATEAIAAGKAEGKPVILVFSASWCPPCQMMKKEVYPSKQVKGYHDQFIWAYLDVDEDSNSKAATKAGVDGIPHIQILSPEGKEVAKQVGSSAPEDFAKKLKGVLAKTKKAE